ncbi:ankyrin repeat domain-containing protein [bacterium]|nr:ankyrin repeat domain-containing protein [bacterium]
MFGGFIGIFIREISFPAKKYVVVVLILISLLLVLSPLQPLLKSEQQEKTLIEYIRNDETEKVKALIEKGADVNQTDETGVTPIMWAAYNGNEGIINFLVKNGADVRKEGFLTIEEEDLKFTVFISPLDAASAKGRLEAVKYLIEEAGLKPDENPGCFNNLLLKEKDIVNFDKVVEVLEKTDHRHVKKLREFYPFAKNDYPISQNEASFLNAMYLMTVKFDLVNEKYDKFLLRRIANNRKKIDEMFKGGIRKAESYEFFIGENGETPLITAIREWHGDVAAYLLSKGADANYKDCSGNTPLSVARKEKRPELIEMLLKNGAKE